MPLSCHRVPQCTQLTGARSRTDTHALRRNWPCAAHPEAEVGRSTDLFGCPRSISSSYWTLRVFISRFISLLASETRLPHVYGCAHTVARPNTGEPARTGCSAACETAARRLCYDRHACRGGCAGTRGMRHHCGSNAPVDPLQLPRQTVDSPQRAVNSRTCDWLSALAWLARLAWPSRLADRPCNDNGPTSVEAVQLKQHCMHMGCTTACVCVCMRVCAWRAHTGRPQIICVGELRCGEHGRLVCAC